MSQGARDLPRYTSSTLATATSDYTTTGAFPIADFDTISVSVQTDHTLTVTFLWGRSSDVVSALPFGDVQTVAGATIAEASGSTYIWDIPADATVGRIKLSNASGSTATVICDVGIRSW